MYRYRQHLEVQYGHMREALEIAEELKAVCRARGWVEPAYWAPTIGGANILISERDFASLADFERETRAATTDPEFMKVLRRGVEHIVQGSVRDELLEPVYHIA